MKPAAMGLRAHSGWAALVSLGGPLPAPIVMKRARVEMIRAGMPAQPYHAAEPLPFDEAEALITESAEVARQLAYDGIRAIADELRTKGHNVCRCGILLSAARPLPALEAILRSHALIHTAEGDLFRGALAHAAERCGLAVVRTKERQAPADAAALLGLTNKDLSGRLREMGREVGPPWRQDEKLAALAAWIALGQDHQRNAALAPRLRSLSAPAR